jgi:hypothetical protein
MPKKSPQQRVDETLLIAWYKWEFLRRNVEYRKDYVEFLREFGGWFEKHGYWYDQTVEPWGKENLRFFASVIAPKARIICERWQIRDPLSPTRNFKKPGSKCYKHHREFLLPTECSKEEAGQEWDLSDFLSGCHLSDEEFRKRLPASTAKAYGPEPDYHLELAIDLRLPLEPLLRQAEDRIRSRKRAFDRRHPKPPETAPTVRRRLNLYDKYLQVWDLRTQGEKFEVIGALVFPDNPRRAQRAMESFRTAKELVGGGYKELR